MYILGNGPGHAEAHERVTAKLRELAGVDLVTWLADADGRPLVRTGVGLGGDAGAPRRSSPATARSCASARAAVIATAAGPSGTSAGIRGRWRQVSGGRFESERYPDALARLWSALTSPHAGTMLVSAADGYECVDWGGVSHVGGSHGALSREDSLALLFVGCGPRRAPKPAVGPARPRPGHPRPLRVGKRRWWT